MEGANWGLGERLTSVAVALGLVAAFVAAVEWWRRRTEGRGTDTDGRRATEADEER